MPTKAGSLSLCVLLILHDTRYIENSLAEAIALRNFSAKMRFLYNVLIIPMLFIIIATKRIYNYKINVVAVYIS